LIIEDSLNKFIRNNSNEVLDRKNRIPVNESSKIKFNQDLKVKC